MSLWFQAATEALYDGNYQAFREILLPRAPFIVPHCLVREFEFAERRCCDLKKDRLFPIRFLWFMEGTEQRLWGLPPLGRSGYHPEKLLELWERVSTDPRYREEREAEGFLFDFTEKAVQLTVGWVYIGERLVEDFLEIEAALGVELLFPCPASGEGRPAFQETKRLRTQENQRV